MFKSILALAIISVIVITESSASQGRFIHPTYRPPPQRPIIRSARDVQGEPLWIFRDDNIPRAPSTGDHPILPSVIDDIHLDPNRRYTRSLSTPSVSRGSGHSTRSTSTNTGPTHPGYNRRNAREVPRYRRDIVIPNWNPNAKIQPYQRIKFPQRKPRSVEHFDSQEHLLRPVSSVEEFDSQEDFNL